MKKALVVGILAAAFLAYWGVQSVSAQEGDKPRPPKELNEDQVIELMNWLRESEPGALEKLERIKKDEPDSYKRSLSELYGKMMERKRGQGPEGEDPNRPQPPRDKQPVKKELSETETAEVVAWLKENDPARATKSEEIKTKSPKDYARFISECYMQMQRDREMAEKNPEEYERMAKTRKLESECFQLAEQYRNAKDEAAKKGLKDQMTQKLSDLFDAREAERAQKIKRQEEELKRLKDELEKRKVNKQGIVEKRLQEMTGEQGDLGW
jgi:hypothetical protein